MRARIRPRRSSSSLSTHCPPSPRRSRARSCWKASASRGRAAWFSASPPRSSTRWASTWTRPRRPRNGSRWPRRSHRPSPAAVRHGRKHAGHHGPRGLCGLEPRVAGRSHAFQAARRLAALGVSAASNSPSVTVFAEVAWPCWSVNGCRLPIPGGIQNPPPTYQNNDFNIWTQQLAGINPQGYLDLDLDALTRGYVISSFAAAPTVGASSGPTLTLGSGRESARGCRSVGRASVPARPWSRSPPTRPRRPPRPRRPSCSATPSPAACTAALTFNDGVPPVTATTTADCPVSTALLTFAGPGGTTGISAGMSAFSRVSRRAPGCTALPPPPSPSARMSRPTSPPAPRDQLRRGAEHAGRPDRGVAALNDVVSPR